MEAINLSINFWFVTPIVFPSIAPVIHPALEALFNIVSQLQNPLARFSLAHRPVPTAPCMPLIIITMSIIFISPP